MRKLLRSMARNNMIAAGLTCIGQTYRARNGSKTKSVFAQHWRKYAVGPKPAPKKATVIRHWRRKLWPQLRPQRRA